MKDRLVEFLAYLKEGQNKFEKKVGLPRGLINKMKDNLTVKTLLKIENAHPELNIDWFLTGKGEMLKSANGASGDLLRVYKEIISEKEAENKHLNREIGALLERIEALERGNGQSASYNQSGYAKKMGTV